MMFKKMCRALEAIEKLSPQKTKTLLKRTYLDSKDPYLLKILNRTGHNREAYIRKLIPNTFNIFEEEVDKSYSNYLDYGNVIYYLDVSAEGETDFPLSTIYNILEKKADLKPYLLEMSALERKWLVRLCCNSSHIPRRDLLISVIAKCFDKEREEVLNHCNYSSLNNVIEYYHKGMIPTSTITVGSFVSPMTYSMSKKLDNYDGYYCRINYGLPYLQMHIKDSKITLFNKKGDVELYPTSSNLPEPFVQNAIFEVNKIEDNFVIYDILYLNNEVLINKSLSERIQYLEQFDNVAEYYNSSDFISEYNLSIGSGYEGIYLCSPDEKYLVNSKSPNYLRYNPSNLEVFAVITSSNVGKFNSFKSFDVSLPNDGSFERLGNFVDVPSKEARLTLENALRKQVIDFKDNKYYFSPRVVVKIRTSGLAYKNNKASLRDVRFISIMNDMYVSECTTLKEMEDY